MAVRLRLRRRRQHDPDGTMTVFEHLGELRRRLIICVAALMLGAVVGWFLFGPVFRLLTDGYCAYIKAHPNLSPVRGQCRLAYLSILEPFLLKVKLVTFIGFALALPVILFQLWRFVTPGLTAKERRYTWPFVLSALALFMLGGWFGWVTLPRALNFLLGFAGQQRLFAVLSIAKYVSFVMLLILAFGASFEFPLVLIALTLVGILSSQKLRKWRRQAILFIAIFAAVITPSQDWFTMTAMMIPLLVFYELSILVTRLLKK